MQGVGPAEGLSGSLGDFGMKPFNDIVMVGVAPWHSQKTLTITAQKVNLSGYTNQEDVSPSPVGYKYVVDLAKAERGGGGPGTE